MLKSALLLFFVLTNTSYASVDFLGLSAQLDRFEYQDDQGEGDISHLQLYFRNRPKVNEKEKGFAVPDRVYVTRVENDFSVQVDFFTLFWKNAPTFFSKITSLSVEGLKGDLGSPKNQLLQLQKLSVDSSLEWLKGEIQGVDFYCLNQGSTEKFERKLLKDCLQLGSFRIRNFLYPFQLKFWSDVIVDIPEESDEDVSRIMEDLLLEFKNGQFDFALKTKILFKTRIKAKGFADVDLEAKKANLRLDEVKVGIIPVTWIVWRELKKRIPNSEDIQIDPPFIKFKWK